MLLLSSSVSCRSRYEADEVEAIPRSANNSIYLSEHLGLLEESRKEGLRLHWNDSLFGDAERQIALIQLAVEHRSYGIVFDTRALYATNVALSQALSHDIPVVVLLSRLPIPPERHLGYILEDVQTSARLVAERLQGRKVKVNDVVLLGSDSSMPGATERFTAVEDALTRSVPATHIVKRIAGPLSLSYYEATLGQFLRAQHVDTVIALNSQAGFAAIEVLRELHLQKTVHVVAFDQSLELLLLLRTGELDSLVVQNMRSMGKLAIDEIVADHHGQPIPAYVLVPPLLVTRDNIDTESVQRTLQMN